ncbi:MAG: hypothetical protein HZA54_12485, partial [Planctomycetes bacterium]|nr:hypothetical protein [Planctomycetota bacterium]
QQQHLSRAHACEACHLRDGKWSLEPYFTMQQMKGGMVGDCKQCH